MKIGNLILSNGAILAPMAGITDMPFRLLCREQGSILAFTEMVSAKGLCYGQNRQTQRLLEYAPQEQPVGAQLFGREPKFIYESVLQVLSMGFMLIDLNMGCPAPKIVSNGEGCALMRDIPAAEKVIAAAVRAAQEYKALLGMSHTPPVTVKFRKGWDEENYIEFARMAESAGASALTIHGRTRSQFYSGRSDLTAIAATKAAVKIPVIGNGDIFSGNDALKMLTETGCDAIMIGRGALGNPWIFNEINSNLFPTAQKATYVPPSPCQKAETALRHAHMLTAVVGEAIAMREMRKHIAWYLKGLHASAALRRQTNSITRLDELHELLSIIIN